ncbi:MAG: glutaredoxin-like protein NrdH [Microbacterium sp.]|nr:glutaredoxin-like protein NrdH [Microbacterium sp.]
MTFEITIYSKPKCNACDATRMRFEKADVPYKTLPLTDEVAAEYAHHGFLAAPIVTTGTRIWAGYRHDEIAATIKRWREHRANNNVTET